MASFSRRTVRTAPAGMGMSIDGMMPCPTATSGVAGECASGHVIAVGAAIHRVAIEIDASRSDLCGSARKEILSIILHGNQIRQVKEGPPGKTISRFSQAVRRNVCAVSPESRCIGPSGTACRHPIAQSPSWSIPPTGQSNVRLRNQKICRSRLTSRSSKPDSIRKLQTWGMTCAWLAPRSGPQSTVQ